MSRGSPDLDTSIYYSTPTGFFVFRHSSLHFGPNLFFVCPASRSIRCFLSIRSGRCVRLAETLTWGRIRRTVRGYDPWGGENWQRYAVDRFLVYGYSEGCVFWVLVALSRTSDILDSKGERTNLKTDPSVIHPYGENQCHGTYAEMKPAASDLRTWRLHTMDSHAMIPQHGRTGGFLPQAMICW